MPVHTALAGDIVAFTDTRIELARTFTRAADGFVDDHALGRSPVPPPMRAAAIRCRRCRSASASRSRRRRRASSAPGAPGTTKARSRFAMRDRPAGSRSIADGSTSA
jgi:hypothetical protein